MGKEVKTINQKKFIDDYNSIMKINKNTSSSKVEWSNKGDKIEKFTMYEDYTPVKTTSGSGMIF